MPKMTTPKNIPKTSVQALQLDRFLGVDFTNIRTQVDLRRSPDSVNMMPELNGFPVKRKGYEKLLTLEGRVNGAYSYTKDGKETRLLHAGHRLYRLDAEKATEIYSAMADEKSRAVQVAGMLMIADGKRLLCFGDLDKAGELQLRTADTCGTAPLISIGRKPDGTQAKSYNPYNLLTSAVIEDFCADGKSTDFVLSYPVDEGGIVTVKERNKNGDWEVKEGYTVDRGGGVVKFSAAPPAPAAEGEDNIKIEYQRKRSEAALKALQGVNSCRSLCAYGVDGQPDRLCLAAENVVKNRIWYSQYRDPLYIGDTWYIQPGQEKAPVVGFGVLGRRLLVYKKGEEHQRNVHMILSKLSEEGDAEYPVVDVTQGESAIAPDTMQTMDGEPLFLSARGVVAVTTPDNGAERYLQERSHYIAGKLTREKDLQEADSAKWGRFYVLAVNGHAYLCDSAQKSYERGSPYSTYQYECYYWENIPARRLWVWEDRLWFGDDKGNVYRFFKDEVSSSYMDAGKPIRAYWTTPLLNLGSWTNLKTVTDVWIVMQPYTRSGATVYYASDKDFFKAARSFNMDIFNWDDIDFDRFTFNTMDTPQIAAMRKKAKKVKLFAVRIENKEPREPFGISVISLRYRTGGKIKR